MLDRAVFVHLRFVGKKQLVSILIVLKEIEDAALFHQARDKVEGSLAILDDVFALRVTALGAVLKILKAVVLEHFFYDLGDGFLLENLAISGARQEPEPRNDFGVVVGKTAVATYESKTAHETVPITMFMF